MSVPPPPRKSGACGSMCAKRLPSGAIGVSTGLYYEPANAAPTEEVIEMCRPLKEHNGIYCTHMRDEAAQVIESLDESFRIGHEVGVPVVISHHKVVGLPQPRSLQADAAPYRRGDAQPVGVPGLLSLYRVIHDPERGPRSLLHRRSS